MRDRNFTCEERDGFYHFDCSITYAHHRISSDPAITSPERLLAHWDGFREGVRNNTPSQESTALHLDLTVRKAKDKLRAMPGIDFVEGAVQILPLDEKGERIEEGIEYSAGVPSMARIRALFKCNPTAVAINLNGAGRMFNQPELAIKDGKYDDTDIVDHWSVNVLR